MLDAKGNFQYTTKLPYGETKVAIEAEDLYDNKSTFQFTLLRYGSPVSQASKGAVVTSIENPIIRKGMFYALFIAEQNYIDKEINDLSFPIADTRDLSNILKSKYVLDSVKILTNGSRQTIMSTIFKYRKNLKEDDNFLLFYSGHGTWDKENGQGYWLPVDAAKDDPSTWISNSDIKDQLKPMKCVHTLLISDACFAGGIFKTREVDLSEASRTVQELYKTKSRKAMTSGALTTVPDKSSFLKYMVMALRNNTSNYLPAEKLFVSFKENAINNSLMSGLIPQFGVIADTDDRGGDFIFIRK